MIGFKFFVTRLLILFTLPDIRKGGCVIKNETRQRNRNNVGFENAKDAPKLLFILFIHFFFFFSPLPFFFISNLSRLPSKMFGIRVQFRNGWLNKDF